MRAATRALRRAAAAAAVLAASARGGWLFGGGGGGGGDAELTAEDVDKLSAWDREAGGAAGGGGDDDFGGPSEVRGVPVRDAGRYTGLRFACDDGARDLAVEAVNDDYCDCLDGSDEPGTSACSGAGDPEARSFFCANEGYRGVVLPASRVFDGICDCCDGTDEAPGDCPNTCEEDGASYRADVARLSKIRDAGRAKKKEYIAQAQGVDADADATEGRLAEVAREIQETEAAIADARGEIERLEEEVEEARRLTERMLRSKRIAALHLAKFSREKLEHLLIDAIVEGGTPEALVKLVQEALDDPLTAKTAEVSADGSIDTGLEGLYAEWVSSDEDPGFFDHNAGGDDGVPDEDLYDDAYAGIDVTDLSEGEDDAATEDEPVVESSGPAAALEGAKSQLRGLERTQRKLEKEERDLKAKGPKDYGPEKQWYAIRDKCITAEADKYKYEICMYGRAKQDKISLGEWSGFVEGSNHRSFKFTKGQRCWNGPERSLTVQATCGPDERIIDVREPSTCEYVMSFTSPAAC